MNIVGSKRMKSTILVVILSTFLLLTGCTLNEELDTSDTESYILSNYGKYEVLDGWIKNKEHSTDDKQFYIKEEDSNNSRPNNISVNGGTNKYSKEQHTLFRQSIMNQLSMQTKGTGAIINGSGATTDNGDILYTFTVTDATSITTQYYIVGDYKYFLVHETTFTDETEEADECAKYIVNTFKWNE